MKKNSLQALVGKGIIARGDKGERPVDVLFDTGAGQSFILRKIAEQIGSIFKLPSKRTFILADNSTIDITDAVTIELDLVGDKVIDTFLVSDAMPQDVILGVSTMRKYGLKIDLERGAVFAHANKQEQLEHLQLIDSLFQSQEDTPMNKVIARLQELFSLAKDASEDTVLAALNAYTENVNKSGTVLGSIGSTFGLKAGAKLEEFEPAIALAKDTVAVRQAVIEVFELKADATVEQIKAALSTAKSHAGELPKLSARVLQLEASTFDNEFNSVIDQAFKAGKILPTQKSDEKWLALQKNAAKPSIAEFKEYWSKQPVIGPVQSLPEDNHSTSGEGITQEDLAIAKQVGVDKATLEKYNTVVVN